MLFHDVRCICAFFDQFDKNRGETTSQKDRDEIIETFRGGEYKMDVNNVFHISMFQNIHNFANLFSAQDWFIYIGRGKKKFVTTDNPVAEAIPLSKGFYGPSFFEREHYFALSPEIFIHCKAPNKNNAKGLRRKTFFEEDAKKVLEYNMILARHALKYIYGKEKEDLEEILSVVNFLRKNQLENLRSGF